MNRFNRTRHMTWCTIAEDNDVIVVHWSLPDSSSILPSFPWSWAQWRWHTEAWPDPWSPPTRRLLRFMILRRSCWSWATDSDSLWAYSCWADALSPTPAPWFSWTWIMMNDMMTTMNTWISLISAPSMRRYENSFDTSWSLSEPSRASWWS